jgi:hypothetical protein
MFALKSRLTTCNVRNEASNPRPDKKKILPLLDTVSAKKRNSTIKENINKLIAIGNNEINEFNELMKEFDIAHKKALKFDSGSESDDDEPQEENIFVKK